MEVQIPTEWLNPVVAVLDGGDRKCVEITNRARLDWEATFPSAFLGDLLDALLDALSEPGVIGRHIVNQPEPGVTYAFWFYHQRRKLYGKICLRPNQLEIKILSAHRPLKGDDSL
jgi:hypothetical protein